MGVCPARGTVLGPILSVIHVYDIFHTCDQSDIYRFADDDTAVIFEDNNWTD